MALLHAAKVNSLPHSPSPHPPSFNFVLLLALPLVGQLVVVAVVVVASSG